MIISGGMNIYPAEIEAALEQHPDIFDVAVFGVPSEEWGEGVHAVVVLAPEAELSDDDVMGFARQQLASYKVPRSISFLDELPRTGSGKSSSASRAPLTGPAEPPKSAEPFQHIGALRPHSFALTLTRALEHGHEIADDVGQPKPHVLVGHPCDVDPLPPELSVTTLVVGLVEAPPVPRDMVDFQRLPLRGPVVRMDGLAVSEPNRVLA